MTQHTTHTLVHAPVMRAKPKQLKGLQEGCKNGSCWNSTVKSSH